MDDITVDLGEIPVEHARTLLVCVERCLLEGSLWSRGHYDSASSLKAMLTYRIAQAERMSEPA